ncbi:MAG: S26 family signal peptidase [Acidimicrobiia bacterium]
MQRFRVSEDSMRPTLVPGDEFVATGSRTAVVGDIVALPHPGRADFWLVKRLGAGPGDRFDGRPALGSGEAWVTSDNPDASAIDSRSFGPVRLTSLQPMVTHLDEPMFLEAVALLADEEERFAAVIAEHGPPPFWARPAGFPTLVWLIMEQQVSLESGAAMYRRLHGLVGVITPEAVARATEADLRGIGVTRQKTTYLIEMSRAIVGGDLDLEAMAQAPPDQARETLLSIKGIGPWTADAYLLSALGFPDVFPVGDRALQVGTAEVLGMAAVPDPGELELLSIPWRPIRAAAARIIWHSYLKVRGRVEPADPTRDTEPPDRRRVVS